MWLKRGYGTTDVSGLVRRLTHTDDVYLSLLKRRHETLQTVSRYADEALAAGDGYLPHLA